MYLNKEIKWNEHNKLTNDRPNCHFLFMIHIDKFLLYPKYTLKLLESIQTHKE